MNPSPTIAVTGEATVNAQPDKVLIFYSVAAESRKLGTAKQQQAEKVQRLLAFLKAQSVAEKDIRSLEYSYAPHYERQGKKDVLKGYEVVQRLQVKADVEKAGVLLDATDDDLSVQGTQFVVSNLKSLHEQAIDLAIKDAKARAAVRANQLGISLGAVVGYHESSPHNQGGRPIRALAAMVESMAMPEVPAGESEIKATVSVTYEIKVPAAS